VRDEVALREPQVARKSAVGSVHPLSFAGGFNERIVRLLLWSRLSDSRMRLEGPNIAIANDAAATRVCSRAKSTQFTRVSERRDHK
jgi:hypothetical protein